MEKNLKTQELKKAVTSLVLAGILLTLCSCCFIITTLAWFAPEKSTGVGGLETPVNSYEVDTVITVTLNENIIDPDIRNEPLLPGDSIVFIIEIKDISPDILCLYVDLSDLSWDTTDIPHPGGGNYTMLDMYVFSVYDNTGGSFGEAARISENIVSDSLRIATVTRTSSSPFENIRFKITFDPPEEVGMNMINKLQQKVFYFGSIILLAG